MSQVKILPLSRKDIPDLVAFTDIQIGTGYFSEIDLEDLLARSTCENRQICSFVLRDARDQVVGVRLTYAPGKWPEKLLNKSLSKKWEVQPARVAYFKSLFIDPKFQGQQLGPRLSELSKKTLKHCGAEAIVCHAWKESPNNSSVRYLSKQGFKVVGEHPLFWHNVDYFCSGCKQPKCTCTGIEMIYHFE